LTTLKQAGERFAVLAAEDIRAYEDVVAARKADATIREQASIRATSVPMEIVALTADVLAHLDDIITNTNPRLLGDLRAAAALAYAAGESAASMVRDNLGTSADPTQAAKLEQDLQHLLTLSERCKQNVMRFQTTR
jgi:formiminotetrahydrofolate cyclodeaminase